MDAAPASPLPRAPLAYGPRTIIRPCDAAAALEIARLLQTAEVAEPYYLGCRETDRRLAEGWTQQPGDWTRLRRMSLVAIDRASAAVVGGLRFRGNELSYLVAPALWRQGYGTEIVNACCAAIAPFLGLRAVQAEVWRENQASWRILEAAGFAFNGLTARQWQGRCSSAMMLRYVLRLRR